MKKFFAGCGFCFALLLSVAQFAYAEDATDSKQQIERVIEVFRKGIINKDKAAFMSLFLRDDITWGAAFDEATIDGIMKRRLDKTLPRPKKTFTGTPREFIEGLAREKPSFEETFDNVRINTDGEVAQVWFDYSFNMDGVRQNSGKEAWNLLRTETGWKIASVVWSMTANAKPKVDAGAK